MSGWARDPMRDAAELLIRNALARDLLCGGNGDGQLRPHPNGNQLALSPAQPSP